MAVFIDIPGIGNIEAKNAASEATLREILKAMKGVQKNTAGGAGGGGGASAGGGSGAAGASNMLSSMGKGAGTAAKALGKMAGAVGVAVGAIVSLSEGAVKTIKAIADVGDSVESAANVFSSLPILGTLFGAVAAASQKVNDSYLAAASGGASFAGSMQQFSASATAAGMTMEKYGQFVSQNGTAMLGLGSTVEEGAKRFSQVSKGLRAVSGDLYALGFSTQEIEKIVRLRDIFVTDYETEMSLFDDNKKDFLKFIKEYEVRRGMNCQEYYPELTNFIKKIENDNKL
jgi:hypothetical protein